MDYKLSRKAEDDVFHLYVEGAGQFGRHQAEADYAGLEQVFAILAEHPRLARERDEITPPVRIHPYRSHIVIYVTDGDDILILRIRHGREDWDSVG
jgi:toxin ParE1/3/4